MRTADLPRPPAHRIRHHPIQPHHAQRQRQQLEPLHQQPTRYRCRCASTAIARSGSSSSHHPTSAASHRSHAPSPPSSSPASPAAFAPSTFHHVEPPARPLVQTAVATAPAAAESIAPSMIFTHHTHNRYCSASTSHTVSLRQVDQVFTGKIRACKRLVHNPSRAA